MALLPRNTLKALKAAFLFIGGAAMIVGGAWIAATNMTFVQHAKRARGTVIEIAAERGARGMKLYFPVVRFRPSGRRTNVVFKAKPGLWPSPFDRGDRVVVGYDRQNPKRAKIISFWMLWFLPGATFLLGIVCLWASRDTMKKMT